MEEKKLKNEQKAVKKNSTKARKEEVLGQARDVAPLAAELVTLWKQEIENVRSEKFENIEQAAAHVASLVVEKLGLPEAKNEETKQFVITLLVTDPDASKVLKSLL